MERALRYLDRDELPPHWERGPLFDLQLGDSGDSSDGLAGGSDSSDDEPREEKDHFVAQLYKFMDDRGTPLNKNPTIANKDIDLYRLFRVVHKLGGYNRVTNQNKWRSVAIRLGYAHNHATYNSVKQAYRRFLLNFEDFYRKLGCTMINHPRSAKKNRGGRSLIRDRDKHSTVGTPAGSPRQQQPVQQQQADRSPGSGGEQSLQRPATPVAAPAPVADPVDTSCSSSDADVTALVAAAPAPAVVSSGSSTPHRSRKQSTRVKTAGRGEKVKALIDKFEEHVARHVTGRRQGDDGDGEEEEDEEEEERPIAPQHTRSKSVGRTASGGRQTPAPSTPDDRPTPSVKQQQPPPSQRGRKRKDAGGEQGGSGSGPSPEPSGPAGSGRSTSPPPPPSQQQQQQPRTTVVVSASVGDKLKVFYGQGGTASHESKVTYEAKVLEVERDMYLVHYTGWNTRYDEWIKPQRIAENLSQQNKAAKQQQQQQRLKGVSPKRAYISAKRGRGGGGGGTTRSPGRRLVSQQQRRTRRTSAVSSAAGTSDTDDERSLAAAIAASTASTAAINDDEAVAKSDSEPEVVTRTASTRRRVRRRCDPDPEDEASADKDEDEKPLKRAKRPSSSVAVAKKSTTASRLGHPVATSDAAASGSEAEGEEGGDGSPKGRDFDLNQIRSELKGFEKAVKASVGPGDGQAAAAAALAEEDVADGEQLAGAVPSTSSPAPLLSPVVTTADPRRQQQEIGDDIYEFKEPEPFEFETSSARKPTAAAQSSDDPKQKKRPQRGTFEGASGDERSPKKGRCAAGSSPTAVERSPSPPLATIAARRRTPNTYRRAAATRRRRSSRSPSTVAIPETVPADEDPFDKLAESPSFNVTPDATDTRKRQEKAADCLSTLFRELPETAGAGDDSGGSDLGPEPPPFARKEQPATALDPIFKGFSVAAAAAAAASQSAAGATPARTSTITTNGSDEDDPIGAAIQRAMTHALTDEDSSGDELFIGRRRPQRRRDVSPPPTLLPQPPAPITDKLISPALQETDPRLLDAISEQTAELLKKQQLVAGTDTKSENVGGDSAVVTPALVTAAKQEPISPPTSPVTLPGTKIADSILHKFNMIKKKEEVKSEEEEIKTEEDEEEEENVVVVTAVAEVSTGARARDKARAAVGETGAGRRRTGTRKVCVSREFIESDSESSCSSGAGEDDGDDTSSGGAGSSDSEPSRLVIAQPADEEDEDEREDGEEEDEEDEPRTENEEEEQSDTPLVAAPTLPAAEDARPPLADGAGDEEQTSDMSLLLCKETIPGSPAAPDTPSLQQTGTTVTTATGGTSGGAGRTKPRSAKSLLLEMPFASAPALVRAPPPLQQQQSSLKKQSGDGHEQEAETTTAILAVPLPPDEVRSPQQQQLPPVYDDAAAATPPTTTTTDAKKETTAGHVGRKRRRSQRASDAEPSPQQLSASSTQQPPPAKRGRGRPPAAATAAAIAALTPNEDNEQVGGGDGGGTSPAAAAVTPSVVTTVHHPRRHPRYNFLVELDPMMDAAQRISLLTQRLSELRRTYNEVKSELACIDRRRKKLRRRERDQLRAQHDVQAAA